MIEHVDWILTDTLAREWGIRPDHPYRWGIFALAAFEPTLITVMIGTSVRRKWAVTRSQAMQLRKLRASALILS
jgi:hypothetical protein